MQYQDGPSAHSSEPAFSPDARGVTFVMPVLNEQDYLARAVESVLDQVVDGPTELILALGPSTDATTQIATEIADRNPRVQLVSNPEADIPKGLNAAIRASKYPTIVRVDAHSELAAGYTKRAVETLERTGAANVGGVMHADGKKPFQRAVARAYNSPFGLGGGAYHGGGPEGEAESAYLGVMKREAIEQVGLFDESIRRGEDWELNLRLRAAGHKVWFDPELSVTYWPRESWARLTRQFFATGTWRAELVRRFGRRNSVRFFAPPALLLLFALSIMLGALQLTGVVSGLVSLILSLLYVPLAAYALLVIGVALTKKGGGSTIADKLWTIAVIPSMHVSWGAGFLAGSIRGAANTVDTSRLDGRNTLLP